MVAAAGRKAAQLCMAAGPLQEASRTNPLRPTRLQAQDFVSRVLCYCYPGGDPQQHNWKTRGIPTPAAYNRALFKFRAAGRQLQPSHVSDAAIQVTAKVTYSIKPERKCSSIQSQTGVVPQASRVRPNVLLYMQTAGRHRGCGEQGRGCFHTAGRLHIQPCHAQARDHPSHICSLLRGWHSPPQSMESSLPLQKAATSQLCV